MIASALSQDRWCYDKIDGVPVNRNGGRAISELLIYSKVVPGLTRMAIRDHLCEKWTRSCAWAGDGASEWGEDNYRVFENDANVPQEGAKASGIGFRGNATLSGGKVTLGGGGIFASQGVVATIAAPIAGHIGVYGPGCVVLSEASSTATSLRVGDGSTLVVASGATLTVSSGSLADDAVIYVESGATLRVSGNQATITGGKIEVASGAKLEFNFTSSRTAPTLIASGLMLPDEGAVNLKVTSEVFALTRLQKLMLLSDAGLEENDISKFILDASKPNYVESISIENGSLLMTSRFRGLIITVR
jgi:hypothetical protein